MVVYQPQFDCALPLFKFVTLAEASLIRQLSLLKFLSQLTKCSGLLKTCTVLPESTITPLGKEVVDNAALEIMYVWNLFLLFIEALALLKSKLGGVSGWGMDNFALSDESFKLLLLQLEWLFNLFSYE